MKWVTIENIFLTVELSQKTWKNTARVVERNVLDRYLVIQLGLKNVMLSDKSKLQNDMYNVMLFLSKKMAYF